MLPPDSNIHLYNNAELEFAKILSAPKQPVTYPISESYITSGDVRDIIFDLPIDFVLNIPIKPLFNTIKTMQDILLEDQGE